MGKLFNIKNTVTCQHRVFVNKKALHMIGELVELKGC